MEIPNEIINKLMRFNSHPVADVFKESFKDRLADYDKQHKTFRYSEFMSFANFYFHHTKPLSQDSFYVYNNRYLYNLSGTVDLF